MERNVPSPSPQEALWITHAQAGDSGAFCELVRIYQARVVHMVYRMCGDIHLAEDVAQEAFLRAWQKLPAYQPKSSFRNWIFRIAANLAIDNLRRENGRFESLEEDRQDVGQKKPESLVAEAQIGEQVQNAVLALPSASRMVLVLREYQGLSYQEIASILDIPVGTVMSRLNYARTCLRQSLKDILTIKEDVPDER